MDNDRDVVANELRSAGMDEKDIDVFVKLVEVASKSSGISVVEIVRSVISLIRVSK
jgi:hypothetical protein